MDELMNFVQKFFENLGAEVSLEKGVLIVKKVPENFEKFYGRKSPYKFSNKKTNLEDVEFVEKGSYTLKAISNFLENSGQTTLLKINLENTGEKEIEKYLSINSKILKKSLSKRYKIFFRFTFHTSFQYLNEREKVINEIYVHDGGVVNGNLEDYPLEEGNKREIVIPDMKEHYFIAKEELKKRLEGKTKKVADKLGKDLEKALERIRKHFDSENAELKDSLNKNIVRLEKLKEEKDNEKILRQEKIVENLKEKLTPFEDGKDFERSVLIEKQKHGLNINNKLFNTTLIYHPVYVHEFIVGKSKVGVGFNPLLGKIEFPFCDCCEKEISKIFVCSSGHVCCKKCLKVCPSCGMEFCVSCLANECSYCGKNICKDCLVQCFKCGKGMCRGHLIEEKTSGEFYCPDCLKRCERCGSLKNPENFKLSPRTKVNVCAECYRKEMQDKAIKSIFK